MIIVGLTGGIGHGKTTFAELLGSHAKSHEHFETWQLVAEVASNLRDASHKHPLFNDIDGINEWLYPLADSVAFCVHTKTSYEALRLTPKRLQAHPENYQKLFEYLQAIQSNPELASAEITTETKEQFRPLLQWLGGYLVSTVDTGIWYNEIVRRLMYLQNSGYELVTVGGVRYPGDAERLRNAGASILEINRPNLPEPDADDITERQRVLITPDSTICNDVSLAALEVLAKTVLHDLALRELQPNYTASQVATLSAS